VAIFNLMEDAATAEIARSQVWQWLHNSVELSSGETVTRELVERVIDEELGKIREAVGEDAFAGGRWDEARSLFTEMALSDDFAEFLTLPAYERMP
jgi:malate synthase